MISYVAGPLSCLVYFIFLKKNCLLYCDILNAKTLFFVFTDSIAGTLSCLVHCDIFSCRVCSCVTQGGESRQKRGCNTDTSPISTQLSSRDSYYTQANMTTVVKQGQLLLSSRNGYYRQPKPAISVTHVDIVKQNIYILLSSRDWGCCQLLVLLLTRQTAIKQ